MSLILKYCDISTLAPLKTPWGPSVPAFDTFAKSKRHICTKNINSCEYISFFNCKIRDYFCSCFLCVDGTWLTWQSIIIGVQLLWSGHCSCTIVMSYIRINTAVPAFLVLKPVRFMGITPIPLKPMKCTRTSVKIDGFAELTLVMKDDRNLLYTPVPSPHRLHEIFVPASGPHTRSYLTYLGIPIPTAYIHWCVGPGV